MKPALLVACEFSGVVTQAFLERGWDAWSCDIVPGEHENHIIGDALDVIASRQWDMLIAHPPCTHLCSSGMHWTRRGLRDPQLTEDALSFVRALLDAPIRRIAVENPVGVISSRIRKPDQIIQPWMFGGDASKRTCLWTKNLPKLHPTEIVPPKGYQEVRPHVRLEHEDIAFYRKVDGVIFAAKRSQGAPLRPVWANQTPSGQNKLGPSPERAKIRSRTYPGIARAMAEQWGNRHETEEAANADTR